MSLIVKGKAAHIAPRRRPSGSQQSQQPSQSRTEQSSRKTSTAESTDHEANEISNLADQYAQSLQQQIQLLQIENSFLKQQKDEQEEVEKAQQQKQLEEHYRNERLREEQQRKELEYQQRRESSRRDRDRDRDRDRLGPPTTQILARGNEVSLNGETWCQLPPYHPPIPAIISDRSSQRGGGGRERSFHSDDYARDRREYSVPCVSRSRHGNSIRERSFVISHSMDREETLINELEEAIGRNTLLEREIATLKNREVDNEKVINSLTVRLKVVETENKVEFDTIVNEKKALLEELLDMQKRIDELAPACAEKELKIVATDNEKLDLTKRLRHANSDISHLQTSIMHLREDLIGKDDRIKTLNEEIQYMQSRILVIESETRELRMKEETNQEKLTAYHQQVREFELTKINDKKMIEKVMEENSSLIKDNAKLSTKLNRIEHVDFSVKQKELKEAQATSETVSELRSALQSERSSSHSLQNKIEIMKQRYEDLEKTISERDKSEDENITERLRVEKELNALHALSKSLSSENKVLREEKMMNEEIIDELKGKIRALEASIRSAQSVYQEKEKQSAAKIMELEGEASKKHQKYLEFEEISKTLHQITALLPSKTSGMTQPSLDCNK